MNDENLIPAKKGEARNPKGKPKGLKSIKTILTKLGKAKIKIEDFIKNPETIEKLRPIIGKGKITVHDLIMMRLTMDAMSGDDKARKMYVERLEGKVPDKVEMAVESTEINIAAEDLSEIKKSIEEFKNEIKDRQK